MEICTMSISKVVRIISYILLFFILFSILSGIWLNFYFNKKLIEIFKEQVSESTNNEYVLSVDELTINLFTHTITVNNLIIEPLKKISHSKAQYFFKAKVLKIIDFSVTSYLKNRDLLIDRVEFEDPQISIFQGVERSQKKKPAPSGNKFFLYSAFSKKINSISIGQIDIMNSKFTIYKNGTDTISVFSTNDNSISINNFNVNSETNKINKLFSAEKFEIIMNKFSYQLENGLYTLYGKSLHASYLDSTLVVDSLLLLPNFSKKEFADEAGRQISRVKIISSKVSFKKMDVKLFFEYNWLVIHKVDLTGYSIDVYRDNTLPLKHIVRPSIQAMLKGLPIFVAVDTIEMKNGNATFEMLNPDVASTGKMTVNKMNLIITGVQNDTLTYKGNESIKVEVKGYVLKQGKFCLNFKFPLSSTKEFFYCSGNITSMPMSDFNSMIRPTKHISIKSGQLDYSSFSFVALENSSKGTMKFMYHDLQVEEIYKPDEKSKLKNKLKMFLVNKLVVLNCNPDEQGIVRISNIHAEHNPYRFFPYYTMQTILSGIAPAIEDEKKIKLLQKKK